MSLWLVIGVTLFVVVVGCVIALLWFRLAAKSAPYRDEVERLRAGGKSITDEIEGSVVVIDERGTRTKEET